MIKILTVIGARPQFIKSAVVSKAIKRCERLEETTIHTGQHFDYNMSGVFFRDMGLTNPKYNLNINSLSHGQMTGRMLHDIENCILDEKPDIVLVYGDTNSTLAGALAAKKLHVPVAHVEAGLRSYNNNMPEEINRILTDRISDFLFCPTEQAVNNLSSEGFDLFDCKVFNSGDVMYDSAMFFSNYAKPPAFNIPDKFSLATIHRAENTDNYNKLNEIFNALKKISEENPVLIPMHPRTKAALERFNISTEGLIITEPVSYLEIIYLLKHAQFVFTDSGGMQKEAFFFKKPCITIREETEWVELVKHGFNKISGTNYDGIYDAYQGFKHDFPDFNKQLYGDGNAAEFIVDKIVEGLSTKK